jgi:hypothetical protein
LRANPSENGGVAGCSVEGSRGRCNRADEPGVAAGPAIEHDIEVPHGQRRRGGRIENLERPGVQGRGREVEIELFLAAENIEKGDRQFERICQGRNGAACIEVEIERDVPRRLGRQADVGKAHRPQVDRALPREFRVETAIDRRKAHQGMAGVGAQNAALVRPKRAGARQ